MSLNRCPSCKKFASLDQSDPDYTNAELNEVTISVSLATSRYTECCGVEALIAEFDIEEDIDSDVVEAHSGKGHELFILDHIPFAEIKVERGITYVGAGMCVDVFCSCQGNESEAIAGTFSALQVVTLEDSVQASLMQAA